MKKLVVILSALFLIGTIAYAQAPQTQKKTEPHKTEMKGTKSGTTAKTQHHHNEKAKETKMPGKK
jgi:hypothetical protein